MITKDTSAWTDMKKEIQRRIYEEKRKKKFFLFNLVRYTHSDN